MASLDLTTVATDPWFDKDARVHAAIEPFEGMEAGYCLLVKIKFPQ